MTTRHRIIITILFSLCLVLFNCKTISYYGTTEVYGTDSYGSILQKDEGYLRVHEVKYFTKDYMIPDLNKKAKNEMWSEDKLQSEINSIPEGGIVTTKLFTFSSMEDVNLKNWTMVFQTLEGQEIFRHQGDPKLGEYTPAS